MAQEANIIDDKKAADQVVLTIENVAKNYGPLQALKGVSFYIRRGTIHGLLGENGAGKSTLVGIISGQNTPSNGKVLLDGVEVQGNDVKAMEDVGVFLVTQEPMIIDHMTVAENLLLGVWPKKRGLINWKKLKEDASKILEGSNLDIDALAGTLDAVTQRKLNILRAMFGGGKVIILDEPTASLNVDDRKQLFDFMIKLKEQGVTFIFISHYNDEILEICDAVTVLRDGSLAGSSDNVSEINSDQLSELVLGRGVTLFLRDKKSFSDTNQAITISRVKTNLLDIENFKIFPGEILGFSGLPGSGAREFAHAVFGLTKVDCGTICWPSDKQEYPLPAAPYHAFQQGIAYLTDDRRRDGVVGHLSIANNMTLSSLDKWSKNGFLKTSTEKGVVAQYFTRMGVKSPSSEKSVDTLSGGNQQKVCLARVLAADPKLLILDEPTRGIDIGVKQDVHHIIDEMTQSQMAIIIVTSDVDEMVRLTDRVCIFSHGKIIAELTGKDITKDNLARLSASK